MMIRRLSRWFIALTIGIVVVLVQAAGFAAMFFWVWQDLSSPSSIPFAHHSTDAAQVVQGELILPVLGSVFKQYRFQPEEVLRLQAIDLETGRVRNIESPDAGNLNGIVSNGERLWFFDGTNTNIIHEFDGTKVVELRTKGQPKNRAFFFRPFIYEKNPALIDEDLNGNYRLFVLVGDTWQDNGQIALPGRSRTWTIDERTGNSVLVPRTTANSIGKDETWNRIWVISANGQYHLFQTESQYTSETGEMHRLIYRNGFEFVAQSSDDIPVSALAPENAVADSTGWVLLDSQLANYPRPFSSNEGFLLTQGLEIWRQTRPTSNESLGRFEPITKVDAITWRQFDMVSTADFCQVYVIARPLADSMELYRLEDRQLQRLPIRIEGLWVPAQRWLARQFFQGLAILAIGILLLISLAARWTGTVTYSFGHDSVVLASLVRRSMARCVDLFLIFGPLIFLSLFLFQFRFNASIVKVMVAWIEDQQQLMTLIPAAVWLGPAWGALVISTGLWGITPGKWLFGIRVVRTTLRPCGIFHALLRELLLWLDVPQLLTAIPGVLCMIVTQKRQRIGDLAADTIVVVGARGRALMT